MSGHLGGGFFDSHTVRLTNHRLFSFFLSSRYGQTSTSWLAMRDKDRHSQC